MRSVFVLHEVAPSVWRGHRADYADTYREARLTRPVTELLPLAQQGRVYLVEQGRLRRWMPPTPWTIREDRVVAGEGGE